MNDILCVRKMDSLRERLDHLRSVACGRTPFAYHRSERGSFDQFYRKIELSLVFANLV